MRRTFHAARPRVFEAFTNPQALSQWWGPAGVTAPRVEVDLWPGGAFEIDMHHDSGNVHYLSGVYEEISPHDRLVFSWAWGRDEDKGPATHVTLEFHDVAAGTEIVLTHRGFATEEAQSQHSSGWGGCFDCLVSHLEQ
jgi:uncharacterized protein YndB with AHSA1/START domain